MNTELIAELRKEAVHSTATVQMRVVAMAAADALEAAQAEMTNLEEVQLELQQTINKMCKAIPDYDWSGGADKWVRKGFAERNAALARLAGLSKQEPVCVVGSHWNRGGGFDVHSFSSQPNAGSKLYAAAGASPEPIPAIDLTSQYRADARAAIQSGGWADAVKKCLPVAECFVGNDGEVINPSPLSTLVPGDGSTIAPLYLAQPSQAVELSDGDVECGAKQLAMGQHYSWESMTEQGRDTLRKSVRAILVAINAKGSL